MTNMNATIYEKHGKYQISISWTVNGKRSHERVTACLIDLAAAADVPLKAAGVHKGRQRVLVKARHGRRVPRKSFAIARHQRIRQHQIADAQSGGKAFRKGVDVHDTACPIQLA